jgi:hypothetical protein
MSKTIDPNQGDADGTVTTPAAGTSRTLEAIKVRNVLCFPMDLSDLYLEESGLTHYRTLSVFRLCRVPEKVCCMVSELAQVSGELDLFPVAVIKQHSCIQVPNMN